jgi:hypothetical protein
MPKTILRGGRVIDPAAGTETIADVVIVDGRVSEITPAADDRDATVVDVTGLVVGPGFVDLHSHVHTISAQRLQAFDGVTTNLELEAGLAPIELAYARAAEEGRVLNYGYSASWAEVRGQVLAGIAPTADFHGGSDILLSTPDWQRSSTRAELDAWLGLLDEELGAGALGIGVLIGYAPESDPAEYLAVARLAAKAGAPTFTHVRDLAGVEGTAPIAGTRELTVAAAETGAAMHHCHVNSTSRRHIDEALAVIGASQAAGSRVSMEAYPYGMGSTSIGAYFLDPDVLKTAGLGPSNIVMLGTGERIEDARRLNEIRATDPAAGCLIEFLDDRVEEEAALLRRALEFPDAIVASDAGAVEWPDGSMDTREWPLPPGGSTHPRTSGTFARSLRLLVREHGMWNWVEAFRRCSYLPARILDDIAPAIRTKGVLAPGADADLVVLDPATITDNATAADPTRPSSGVRHLIVGGTFVIRDGELDVDAYPGQPVRGVPR